METNIALGSFVNSTQLLFRVMGAPPCHNNSLKEEQFNVNNIFSICLLMKTFQSTGKMFLRFEKKKHNRRRWTDSITVKSIALAHLNESVRWHTSICLLLHSSKRCHTFQYLKISMQFSQGTPPNLPADWFAWLCLQENWGISTCQAPALSSEEFDCSVLTFWERLIQFTLIMRQLDRNTTCYIV